MNYSTHTELEFDKFMESQGYIKVSEDISKSPNFKTD